MAINMRHLLWLLAILAIASAQNQCRNGNCISIYQCPHLLKMLQSKFLTTTIVNTLRQAQCVSETSSQAFVCCTEPPKPSVQVPSHTATRITQLRGPTNGQGHVLPKDCGLEPTTIKIIGGTGVELNEYPWMAILEYERRDGSWTLECGGFLINSRYVLTAAHCVVGQQVEKVGKLVNIRLGEYNTETDRDCVQLDKDTECADDLRNYAIEEVISHPNYRPSEVSFYQRDYDIALIRLSDNVRYSEFVAPVCLPSAHYQGTPVGRNYTVVGWGRTLVSQRSPIKLKVAVPAVSFDQCNQFYQTRKITLVESQLCAGGNYAQDSCTGDSGGPLMSQERNAWIAEGIVSFGVGCGLERPSVYTKVQSFLPWIKNNLRP